MAEWPKYLPSHLEPSRLADPEHLRMTASILSSFLGSTLEVTANPGMRTVYDSECRCDVCGKPVEGSHLRPKKVDRLDRDTAERELNDALASIVVGDSSNLEDIRVEIQNRRDLAEALALVAYGRHLIRRSGGEEDPTAAALVLWRTFAWTSSGAPKRNFRLTCELIASAETCLIQFVKVRNA